MAFRKFLTEAKKALEATTTKSSKNKKNPTSQTDQTAKLGYLEIMSKFKDLGSSTSLKATIRNLKKEWKPFILELKEMAEELQQKKPSDETKTETSAKPDNPISQLLAIATQMAKEIDELTTSINYDLYLAPNKEEADAIKSAYAVILYQDTDGKHYARIIAKKKPVLKINKDLDGKIPISESDYTYAINTFYSTKKTDHEVALTEDNIKALDKFTKKITSAANLPASTQDTLTLMNGAYNISKNLPKLLEIFAKVSHSSLPLLRAKVEENYQKFKELKQQFASETTEQKTSTPIDLTAKVKAYLAKIESELKDKLDENVFQNYFVEKKTADIESPWIQQLANSFHNIKEIVERMDKLQKTHKDLLTNENPLSLIEQNIEAVSDLVSAGLDLTKALKQLSNNPHLRELISQQKMEMQLQIASWSETGKTYSDGMNRMVTQVKQSKDSLVTAIEQAVEILMTRMEAAEITVNQKTSTALIKIAGLVGEIKNLRSQSEDDSLDKPSLISFIIKNLDSILKIKDQISNIQIVLSQLSKEEAKNVMKEINSAFNQLMLLADKVEIQLCLKEGLITEKLRPILNSYYDSVNKLGYDFKEEDRFDVAIEKQRNELLDNNQLPELQRSLLEKRIQDQKQKNIHTVHPSTKMNAMLQKYIKNLERIRTEISMKNVALNKQIDLFQKLSDIAPFNNLDNALKEFRQKYPDDVKFLFTSNNASLLKKLELSESNILQTITTELTNLKKQRGSTYFFHAIEQTKILEQRINACEYLQILIQNHSLKDALGELAATHQLQVLQKYDAEFLNHLALIEKNIPIQNKPKTLIGSMKVSHIPRNDSIISMSDDLLELKSQLIELVNSRLNELKDSFYVTTTKDLKITLLKELKKQLNLNYTLDSAISRMKHNDEFKDNIHLLFEGNTGQVLRTMQNMTMTKDELVHRLDAEINALKKERYSYHFLDFANTRKKNIAKQHIELLQDLKTHIQTSNGNMKDILRNLSTQQMDLLSQYEPDLVKALNKLPNVNLPRQK